MKKRTKKIGILVWLTMLLLACSMPAAAEEYSGGMETELKFRHLYPDKEVQKDTDGDGESQSTEKENSEEAGSMSGSETSYAAKASLPQTGEDESDTVGGYLLAGMTVIIFLGNKKRI